MKSIGLLLALALTACSSSDVPAHRVGAVSGNEFWTFPATGYNPVDGGGQLAAVGDIYQDPAGTAAWVRYGTSNTQWQPFPSVAATSSQAGLMTAAQASTLANTSGAMAEVAYTSPPVDLTTTPTVTIVPAAPSGFVFVPLRVFEVNGTVTGSASGAPTVSVGNNGSTPPNNVISASAIFPNVAGINLGANGQTNAAIAGGVVYGTGAYVATVTAAETGATVCSVRYSLVGYWQPIP
jgi:hypothetical protein